MESVRGSLGVQPARSGSVCTSNDPNPVDFLTPIEPVTILANNTGTTLRIRVCGDSAKEAAETVQIVIPPIPGVTVLDDRATLTINDND